MIPVLLGTGLVGLAVGWVLGMWTRKRSDTWCPVDGTKMPDDVLDAEFRKIVDDAVGLGDH